MLTFRKTNWEQLGVSEPHIMTSFPAPNEGQVTLANWRLPPFNRWGFHHVRELVPSAPIYRTEDKVDRIELTPSPALKSLAFEGPDGREWTIDKLLPATWTDGFIVMQRGRALLEWYDSGFRPETPHIVFSVSKSISAILAGIAIGNGQLDPEAPVSKYIPEVANSAYADCTVRHVLDMTVSVNFIEDYLDSQGDFARYRVATGWNPIPQGFKAEDLRGFLTTIRRGPGPHGKIFHYVSPNSDLLGWILERATGLAYAHLLSDTIWRKLGTEFDAYITVDRMGAPRTAGGICTSLRDLARFGEMVRNRGKAHGAQIVPDWWIDDIRTKGDPAAWAAGDLAKLIPGGRYRGKWYSMGNDHGAHCAIGIHGQWIYIDPASEVVIVKLSSQPLPLDDAVDRLLLTAFDAIARKLG